MWTWRWFGRPKRRCRAFCTGRAEHPALPASAGRPSPRQPRLDLKELGSIMQTSGCRRQGTAGGCSPQTRTRTWPWSYGRRHASRTVYGSGDGHGDDGRGKNIHGGRAEQGRPALGDTPVAAVASALHGTAADPGSKLPSEPSEVAMVNRAQGHGDEACCKITRRLPMPPQDQSMLHWRGHRIG